MLHAHRPPQVSDLLAALLFASGAVLTLPVKLAGVMKASTTAPVLIGAAAALLPDAAPATSYGLSGSVTITGGTLSLSGTSTIQGSVTMQSLSVTARLQAGTVTAPVATLGNATITNDLSINNNLTVSGSAFVTGTLQAGTVTAPVATIAKATIT
ncbi:MAG: hypothetical protein N3F11_03430, partial [Casimicrobiaceae bacterium]|nr:hypothetical protein [Casimicrobiaceae bacterium]